MTYAIRNKRTGKWLYGTDFRYSPWHQRTSHDKAMLFEDYTLAKLAFQARRCGKEYEIVPIRIEVLESVERKEDVQI